MFFCALGILYSFFLPLSISVIRNAVTGPPLTPSFFGVSVGQLLPSTHAERYTHCQRNPCAMQKAQIFRAERHECLIQQLHCFFFFLISLSALYSNPIHPLISTSPPSGTVYLISELVLRTSSIILPFIWLCFSYFVLRPFQSSFPSSSAIRINTSDGTRLTLFIPLSVCWQSWLWRADWHLERCLLCM